MICGQTCDGLDHFAFYLINFGIYSEIDHIHLSSEAQCVSHLYPQVDCHTVYYSSFVFHWEAYFSRNKQESASNHTYWDYTLNISKHVFCLLKSITHLAKKFKVLLLTGGEPPKQWILKVWCKSEHSILWNGAPKFIMISWTGRLVWRENAALALPTVTSRHLAQCQHCNQPVHVHLQFSSDHLIRGCFDLSRCACTFPPPLLAVGKDEEPK